MVQGGVIFTMSVCNVFSVDVWVSFSILDPAGLGQSVIYTLTTHLQGEQLTWNAENVNSQPSPRPPPGSRPTVHPLWPSSTVRS